MAGKITYFRPPGCPTPQQRAAEYGSTEARKEANRFYASTRWRKLRLSLLRQCPLCQRCLGLGTTTPAEEVHHILERKERPELAFTPSNLVPLCASCHAGLRFNPEAIPSPFE